MSKHVTHGYHLVKGKSYHDMEDYVFAQFKQIDDNELGLFAIYDGHLSHDIPDYLKTHLFENIINEVLFIYQTSYCEMFKQRDNLVTSSLLFTPFHIVWQ